jgi:hypothetical protein
MVCVRVYDLVPAGVMPVLQLNDVLLDCVCVFARLHWQPCVCLIVCLIVCEPYCAVHHLQCWWRPVLDMPSRSACGPLWSARRPVLSQL